MSEVARADGDGLVASYSFDEGTGPVARDSSGAHNAVLHGAEWTDAGRFGGAIRFQAKEHAHLTIPASPEFDFSEGFTLEAWVRPEEERGWAPVLAKVHGENPDFSYVLEASNDEGNPQGTVHDAAEGWSVPKGTKPLPQNAWSHLALVSDGEHIRLYVDGELVDTNPAITPRAAEAPLEIGGSSVWGSYFDGTIDNVRIYDRPLSGAALLRDSAAPVTWGPPANAIRFLHNADGRLKEVVEPAGGTATYNWDAAGNLLSISRGAASSLSIGQITPDRGNVGEPVRIDGTGFSSIPESDVVKFNGTQATVLKASPWAIWVDVPGGAESGLVTVSTPSEGPAVSSEEFVVGNQPGAPSISGLSSNVVATGEELTILGSNFESAVDDVVTLNNSRPEIVSASKTAITVAVPAEALGGRVTVATADGEDGGPDVYIPPNKAAASTVGDTGRFSIGEPTVTTITKAGTVGLKLFDAKGGEKLAFTLSEATFAGRVSIWSPKDSQLGGSEANFTTSGGGIVEPVLLPESGTYTVRIEGTGSATGSVKLNAYKVNDVTGSITPAATAEGATQHVAITTPGQIARYSVAMGAGENVLVRALNQ
ncbi:MAG TPA: LamG-like jellyroll fold domain-containing protein, partial [Solirubrobacterales bacterium]|nr:LamG-like jellyroll fold domain-containing protein [Solirubrobacterales bacterium]